MTHPAADNALGLAIGTTTLVAVRQGRPPVARRAVLTLWPDTRPAEVGAPPATAGTPAPTVLRGFVERVGDPVPIVAADGSAHLGADLTAAALAAMARAADGGTPTAVVVAAPAYWGPNSVAALRTSLATEPMLSASGGTPLIVSDTAAALVALQRETGLPTAGVVAVCDFGGGGASITMTDAGAGFTPIGDTVRIPDFAGDRIDQALADTVLARLRSAGHTDPAETAPVGTLLRLRDDCRLAKEQLSAETTAVVPVDLPTYRTDLTISRADLDALIEAPFATFLDALADTLERQRIPVANLAAVALIGGGAAIPLISRRLSEQLRGPLVTAAQPGLAAARGAALIAAGDDATRTGLAVAVADDPTGLAPTAMASAAVGQVAPALAWSQDDEGAGEPVPYAGEDYSYTPPPPTEPVIGYQTAEQQTMVVAAPDPWYRRPALLFGISAVVAAVAVGGLAITLTAGESTPTTTTTRVTKPGEPGTSTSGVPAPQTVTVTGGNGQTTVTTITPTTTAATSTTSTTTPTTTTTTTPTTTTTTTTTTPTTTTTTTTTPTTTRTTTTTTSVGPPTTTTLEPPPTTAEPVITTQAVTSEFPLPTTKPAPEE